VTSKFRKLKIIDLNKPDLSQSRVDLDPGTIADYKEKWEYQQSNFPPIVVYQDGEQYHIADGFHRVQSLMLAMLEQKVEHRTINCDVRSGNLQDAIAYSLGANLGHGLRPNTADKKRAILLYYGLSAEHCAHSNNQVAKICGCSHTFVGGWKATCMDTPLNITFAETKIPMASLIRTIGNLKAAQAEGKIVTTRNGKVLEQKEKVSSKAPEEAPKSFPKEHLMLPTDAEMAGLQISSKALQTYIFTNPNDVIPRGKIIRGFESLTNPGHISIEWDGNNLLILVSDAIALPFAINSTITPTDEEIELIVEKYSLIGTDLKVHSIDLLGFSHNYSISEVEPYIKKDAVEKSTPPILDLIGKLPFMPEGVEHLDLSILTTNQLHEIIATIGHEIYRRENTIDAERR
jgi:hypothetical protein